MIHTVFCSTIGALIFPVKPVLHQLKLASTRSHHHGQPKDERGRLAELMLEVPRMPVMKSPIMRANVLRLPVPNPNLVIVEDEQDLLNAPYLRLKNSATTDG